jgi:Arc/MetJ-type ribon-helix-helix transcriptional regulator
VARNAEKVAVSLDREVLAHAERLRKSTGESRSALVGRALRHLLQSEMRSARVAEYVEAYRRTPETAHDVRRARTVARRSIAALRWDEQ